MCTHVDSTYEWVCVHMLLDEYKWAHNKSGHLTEVTLRGGGRQGGGAGQQL